MTGISVTHMPESIGCSLAVPVSSNAGNVTGSGTSAWLWPNYALVILRCWQFTFTGSGAAIPPPVHTAMVLTRRQNTWCYSAQLTTRSKGTSGQEENSVWTLNAYGTSSNGSGWWPAPAPPPTGNEKEKPIHLRKYCAAVWISLACAVVAVPFLRVPCFSQTCWKCLNASESWDLYWWLCFIFDCRNCKQRIMSEIFGSRS